MMKYKPRILVVENDKSIRDAHERNLNHWSFTPILAEGEGLDLLEDAKRKASQYHCHLAIVDLHLIDEGDDEDKSGFELIKALEPTKTIIISSTKNFATVRELYDETTAIGFINKTEGPEKIKQKLNELLPKYCACFSNKLETKDMDESEWEKIIGDLIPDIKDSYWEEGLDILVNLFNDAKKIELSYLLEEDIEKPLRHRHIFFIVKDNHENLFLVKLASKNKIQKEIKNLDIYEKLVDQKSQNKILWNLGGIKYNIIGENHPRLFSTHFVKTNPEETIKSLDSFFKGWAKYKPPRNNQRQYSLFKDYSEVWNSSSQNKWNERLLLLPNGNFLNLPNDCIKSAVPNPVRWFEKYVIEKDLSIGPSYKAITFGDLLCDNIIVDQNGDLKPINFERFGYGPVLQDFVELEIDLITRLARYEKRNDLLKLCDLIFKPQTLGSIRINYSEQTNKIQKLIEVISSLRKIAVQLTGIEDIKQYLWGLLFNTLFRAGLFSEDEEKKFQDQTLLIGGIICDRLDHLIKHSNKEWSLYKWETEPESNDRQPIQTTYSHKPKIFTKNPEIFINNNEIIKLKNIIEKWNKSYPEKLDKSNFLSNATIKDDFIQRVIKPFDIIEAILSEFKKFIIEENNPDYHPLLCFLEYFLVSDNNLTDSEKTFSRMLLDFGRENQKILKVRSAVGLVQNHVEQKAIGTGVLINKQYFLTCNHVVGQHNFKDINIYFSYYEEEFGKLESNKYSCNDIVCLNRNSDFTLIKLDREVYCNNIKINLEKKNFITNASISMIHHPDGMPSEVIIEGKVKKFGNDYLFHTLEGKKGSSGAPIFNKDWELIAIYKGKPDIIKNFDEGTFDALPIYSIHGSITNICK